ncbi:unnamed protein product [Cuscuta campestris]|uniref:CCHC-type domain-containing protein n=1 Tax=Cuscuta campestris TaxID=132261 RepID=A0A484N2L0_9ASTE|nr:unnamed protein product [Cuscuta campestris]
MMVKSSSFLLYYERVPSFCNHCKKVGHNHDSCPRWKPLEGLDGQNMDREKHGSKTCLLEERDTGWQVVQPKKGKAKSNTTWTWRVKESGNKGPWLEGPGECSKATESMKDMVPVTEPQSSCGPEPTHTSEKDFPVDDSMAIVPFEQNPIAVEFPAEVFEVEDVVEVLTLSKKGQRLKKYVPPSPENPGLASISEHKGPIGPDMGSIEDFTQTISDWQAINLNKSQAIVHDKMRLEQKRAITRILGIKCHTKEFTYLGSTIVRGKLRKIHCKELVEKFEKRITSWYSRKLNQMGRLILIKHVLSSIPLHLVAAQTLPKSIIKCLNGLMANFFWGAKDDGHKYHWRRWTRLCLPFEEGGLGLRDLNLCQTAASIDLWWKVHKGVSIWSSVYAGQRGGGALEVICSGVGSTCHWQLLDSYSIFARLVVVL